MSPAANLISVDIDIRKPDTGNVTIDRPTPTISHQNTDASTTPDHMSGVPHFRAIYTEPVSEGEEDEDMAVGIAVDEIGSARVPLGEALEAIAWREKEIKKQEAELEARLAQKRRDATSSSHADEENERQPFLKDRLKPIPPPLQRLAIDPLAPASVFDESLQKKLKKVDPRELNEDLDTAGPSNIAFDEETNFIRDFVAQPGKRIAVPVRVEPKVYFAQERTFLVSDCVRKDPMLIL
jgi:hypothetical protein